MKLSCFEMLLGDRPVADKFAMVSESGFDAIDLRGDLLHGHIDEIRACSSRTGLPVGTVYGRLSPLLAASGAERQRSMDLLRSRLANAAAVGAGTLVVVPITGPPQVDVDLGGGVEQIEWALLGVLLSEILADDYPDDVTMVLEPLNASETHFIRSPTEAADFTRRLGDPRLATMIDTYHLDLEGQDPVGEVAAVGDQLRLVHLSDRRRALPGRGGIDFMPVLHRLQADGYNGYAGFECSGPFQLSELASSVRWVREQLRGGC